MRWLRASGILLPLLSSCALFAAWLQPSGTTYTWLRPLELVRDAVRARHFPVLAVVALGLGWLARRGSATAPELVRLRASGAGAWLRSGLVACAFVGAASLTLRAGYDELDYAVACIGVAVALEGMGLTRVPQILARGVVETGLVALCIVLVSYVFTVLKARLFVHVAPRDAVIVAAEEAIFGSAAHRALAAYATVEPSLAEVSDAIYFRIFDHMLVGSLFLVGLGDRALRARYFATLCVCYLVGVLAYHALPAFGPAYYDASRFGFLREHAPTTVYIQQILADNTRLARTGAILEMPSYGFVAAMPSLHVAHELVMLRYASRSWPFFALTLAFFVGTCVAVLVLGFHYLLDVAGGAALGGLALVIVERVRMPWLPTLTLARRPAAAPELETSVSA